MAQKALKTLAAKNAATLNTLHLVSLAVHAFFLLLTTLFVTRSRKAWFLISIPSLVIEFWFERISRPTYNADGEIRKAGEDLEAKGLTEWMWDVVYWTWGCVVLAAVAGNWVWWIYTAIPLYSAYKAYTIFIGARSGFSGLSGAGGEGSSTAAQSKRQAKMEKRGGQKVQYR